MIKNNLLDTILYKIKKLVPAGVFNLFAPAYYAIIGYSGAFFYGFPSKKIKVIGVTGTKGKSTVVYLITKILEANSRGVAACGSLGYKIKEKEWPNTIKMTMPGRFRLHKLMAEAVRAGCEYFVLEVTSEGIKQKRHLGITFDCAVFTNLHKEHIESHGSFEKYYQAKQELFRRTNNIHVINADDPNYELFSKFSSRKTIFYGLSGGDIAAKDLKIFNYSSSFNVYGTEFNINLAGKFNVSNFLAALATGAIYGVDLPTMKPILESIKSISGRMEFLQKEPFPIIIDYAHTPDSLRSVYETIHKSLEFPISNHQSPKNRKLICVLGAAGGGRDRWKRTEFGKIAEKYCDKIVLTNEDPYDEKPGDIISDIQKDMNKEGKDKTEIVIDRKEAIKKAVSMANEGDAVVITGKGSENSMAINDGNRIYWSDKEIVEEMLKK